MANATRSDGTKQILRDQWKPYFDRFNRRYLEAGEPEAATIEVISPTLGDEFDVQSARLLGVAYDPKSNLFELDLEDMEHLIFEPEEIWVIEGADGFVSTLEVLRADGTKEIVYVRKSGPVPSRAEPPARAPDPSRR